MWISPDIARQFHSPYAYSPDPINTVDPDGNKVEVAGAYSGEAVSQLSSATGLPLAEVNGEIIRAAGPINITNTSTLARDVLTLAIQSMDVITLNTVSNDPVTFIDAFATNNVDVADIGAFFGRSNLLGAATWTHVLNERAFAVHNKLGYTPAHANALRLEAKVMGATTRTTSRGPGQSFNVNYSGPRTTNTYNFTLDPNLTPQ